MLSKHNVTFLVQGPIYPQTQSILIYIRQFFPESKIILSTWKGADIKNLTFDHVVLNDDVEFPGKMNVNRQLLSTQKGLEKVYTDYVVKTRTDVFITSDMFFRKYEPQSHRRKDIYYLFKEKILSTTLFCRNPRKYYSFHPSDIFLFGRTEDMMNWWFSIQAWNPNIDPSIEHLVPEQHFWTSFLVKKNLMEKQQDAYLAYGGMNYHDSKAMRMYFLSEVSIFNNFQIYYHQDLGICYPEKFVHKQIDFCYDIKEIAFLNSHYCERKQSFFPNVFVEKKPGLSFIPR